MDSAMLQLSVGGVLVIIVLEKVFSFIRWWKNGKPSGGSCQWTADCYGKVKDLHDWHRPDAETHRFSWYTRDEEIIKAIEEMKKEVVRELRDLRKDIKRNGG